MRVYRDGMIVDYLVVPDGRLVRGVAPVVPSERRKPAGRDAIRKRWFHVLEAAACVQSVKGRGWYGLRRLTMDLAPVETDNERTLNRFSMTSTEMRNSRYQDRADEAAALEAAEVAARLRTRHRVGGTTIPPTVAALRPELAARTQE